jgi:hypothetical protein
VWTLQRQFIRMRRASESPRQPSVLVSDDALVAQVYPISNMVKKIDSSLTVVRVV